MTHKEIIEGNKLIAEFMGLKWKTYEGVLLLSNNNGKSWFGKLYDKDWSQLMPVVEKIRAEYKKRDRTPDEITEFCHVTGLLICTPIEIVWKNIVTFLKWYNSLSK